MRWYFGKTSQNGPPASAETAGTVSTVWSWATPDRSSEISPDEPEEAGVAWAAGLSVGAGAAVGGWAGSVVTAGLTGGTLVATLTSWQAEPSRVKMAQAINMMDKGWRVIPRVFMVVSLFR